MHYSVIILLSTYLKPYNHHKPSKPNGKNTVDEMHCSISTGEHLQNLTICVGIDVGWSGDEWRGRGR